MTGATMTDMILLPAGLIEIAGHEGIVPAPYLDSAGVWTWGSAILPPRVGRTPPGCTAPCRRLSMRP
jgi:GH24 family phage-related lysozyme (muramidase)